MKGWSGKVLPKVWCNQTLEDVEKGITAFPEIHLEFEPVVAVAAVHAE